MTSLKPGVGLVFTVDGAPAVVEMAASPESGFRIGWAQETPSSFEDWVFEVSGTAGTDITRLELPKRDGGVWLLWFTDLPEQSNGKRYARIAEIQFLS